MELRVRGFLFKGRKLIGVYTRDGLIPVTYDVPYGLDVGILKGKERPKLFLRRYSTHEGDLYDVVLVLGIENWHIASFVDSDHGYPPPGAGH